MDLSTANKLQNNLAKKVVRKNILPSKIQNVCGVDVSYKGKQAKASAVIFNTKTNQVIDTSNVIQEVTSPYIPGYFMLREGDPILLALKGLTKNFDVLLVDGNGILHPRMCGLASYIGILTDKPTIGVAKKLLCGKVTDQLKIKYKGKILGKQLIFPKKTIYVSIGHKINLRTACKIIKELTLVNNWYPEPLRLADKFSKF